MSESQANVGVFKIERGSLIVLPTLEEFGDHDMMEELVRLLHKAVGHDDFVVLSVEGGAAMTGTFDHAQAQVLQEWLDRQLSEDSDE